MCEPAFSVKRSILKLFKAHTVVSCAILEQSQTYGVCVTRRYLALTGEESRHFPRKRARLYPLDYERKQPRNIQGGKQACEGRSKVGGNSLSFCAQGSGKVKRVTGIKQDGWDAHTLLLARLPQKQKVTHQCHMVRLLSLYIIV